LILNVEGVSIKGSNFGIFDVSWASIVGPCFDKWESILRFAIKKRDPFDTDVNLEAKRCQVSNESKVQVIFQGFQTVLTVVPAPFLSYPAVAENCALSVLKICENYTAHVLLLSPSHFQPLLRAIDWGLSQPVASITRLCLRALEELTKRHLDDCRRGTAGLSNNSAPGSYLKHI
jgi:hypothetical protein